MTIFVVKVFLDFNNEVTKLDNEILRDIIKYDYLMFNKRRGMPEFLGKGVTKEEENIFKEALREKYSFKDYYIESFKFDINKFINEGEISENKTYFLFGYDTGVVEIEDLINISGNK